LTTWEAVADGLAAALRDVQAFHAAGCDCKFCGAARKATHAYRRMKPGTNTTPTPVTICPGPGCYFKVGVGTVHGPTCPWEAQP